MYPHNTLIPTEAILPAALGTLAMGPMRYGDLPGEVALEDGEVDDNRGFLELARYPQAGAFSGEYAGRINLVQVPGALHPLEFHCGVQVSVPRVVLHQHVVAGLVRLR